MREDKQPCKRTLTRALTRPAAWTRADSLALLPMRHLLSAQAARKARREREEAEAAVKVLAVEPALPQATKASVQQPDNARGTSSPPPRVRSQLEVSKPLNVRSPSFAPGLPSVPLAAPLVQGPWHDARATKAMRDELKMEGGVQPPKREAKCSDLPQKIVLKIPEALMGVVIGKNGATIKRLIEEAAELRCSIRVLSKRALMVICGAGQDVEVKMSTRSMSA